MSRPYHDFLYNKLVRKMKTLSSGGGGGGGGALTADSVDSLHILNGAVDTDEINDGAITIPKFAPDFVAVLQEFANRIMTLEQTAVIRSFDTLVTPLSNFSIPVDLVESESLKINVSILIGGTGNQTVFLKYNTASGTNINWPKFNGDVVYGETPAITTVTGGDGVAFNNGLIAVNPLSGQSINIEIDLYRSFDINAPTQTYFMKASSLAFWTAAAPTGVIKIDVQGATGTIINGLHFSVAAGTTLRASYSIIKDQRRTLQNGPLL